MNGLFCICRTRHVVGAQKTRATRMHEGMSGWGRTWRTQQVQQGLGVSVGSGALFPRWAGGGADRQPRPCQGSGLFLLMVLGGAADVAAGFWEP